VNRLDCAHRRLYGHGVQGHVVMARWADAFEERLVHVHTKTEREILVSSCERVLLYTVVVEQMTFASFLSRI
jgi:hypothetical protein